MTDRLNTLTVILERPTIEDDVEPLVAAICAMRGVLRVERGEVDVPGVAYQRDAVWSKALYQLMKNGPDGENDGK